MDYGKEGIDITLDPEWNVTIFKPSKQKPIENPIQRIKDSINKPIGSLNLKEIVKKKGKIKSVCIIASDATRPVPSHLILEALIVELNIYGIADKQIYR